MKLKYYLIPLMIGLGFVGSCFGYENRYKIGSNKYIQIVDNNRTFTQTTPYNWTNLSWTIDSIGNITTKESGVEDQGLFLPINNAYNRVENTMSVFWNNNELYYYSQNNTQGRFVYFCTGTIDSYVSTTDNDFYRCVSTVNGGGLSGTGNLLSIEEFNTNSQYHNNIVAFLFEDSNGNGNYNGNPSPFGFVYSDNSFVIFPIYIGTSSDKNFNNSLEINQSQPMNFTKFQSMDSLKQGAPIISGGGGGGSTVSPLDDDYTVGEVLSAYSELGYSTDLCRSHFAIDDLAVSGDMTQFYDWTLTTGASIFDLYNMYSGGVGFDTFMNSRYSRWYPSYTHQTTLGFVGYPKGLWRIPYILYIRKDSITNLTYRNYYYYCYFALYGSYSGPGGDRTDSFDNSMLGSGSLPTDVIDVLDHIDSIGEGVFPIEGSVFYNTGAFVPGGGAGGGGSDLEEEDPLCSELDDPVSQFKCFYNKVSNISFDLGDNPGILPRVIGLAFLLALLFYVFRR